MRDEGEPISRGQLDRRAADAQALRKVLWFVALFSGSVLINGILFILLIAWLQAIGLWEVAAAESAHDAAANLSGRLGARLSAGD